MCVIERFKLDSARLHRQLHVFGRRKGIEDVSSIGRRSETILQHLRQHIWIVSLVFDEFDGVKRVNRMTDVKKESFRCILSV